MPTINLDPAENPTLYRRGDEDTTLKATANAVSQAYDRSIDVLDTLLELSIRLRENGWHTPYTTSCVEIHIERMKSVLEAENLRFYYMARAIRKSDPVEKIRAWKAMTEQDVALALLREGSIEGDAARRERVQLVKDVVTKYGLEEIWKQAEESDASETMAG